jgi:uncharacterized protein
VTKHGKCPLCGKPSAAKTAPFCSQGCKDRDLIAWLSEGYRIPVHDDETERETGLDTNGGD